MAEDPIAPNVRVCTRCGESKPATAEFFNKELKRKVGLTATCKVCRYAIRRASNWPSEEPALVAERRAALRLANLDKSRAQGRKSYHANREARRAYALTYVKANRESIRAYENAKYHSRADVRVRISISNGMRRSIADGKAGRSWEALVGYTKSDLMRHLERQFRKGMTWANYGDWHIDHIIPLSSFSISSVDSPDFRHAWAITNLQPLWAFDNISKKDKRLTLL